MLHMNGGKWRLILGAPSLNMWPWWSLASIGQHYFTSGITTPFIRDFEFVHSRHRSDITERNEPRSMERG